MIPEILGRIVAPVYPALLDPPLAARSRRARGGSGTLRVKPPVVPARTVVERSGQPAVLTNNGAWCRFL